MKILCLMGLFPEEYENTIINDSVSGIQNAANKLQWAIVDGLNQQENVDVRVINSLFIGSFPKRYKKAIIPSFDFSVNGNKCGYNVGFLNLPLIKVFSKYITTKKVIDKWACSDDGDEEKIVIAYAMTSPVVELLNYIKTKYSKIKCILFVPDLPEYMNFSSASSVYKYLKSKHKKHLKRNLRSVDGYVFLTEHMKNWFETDVKYTVIEGIYKEVTPDPKEEILPKEKIILYSGGLHEEYGVLDLVNSFRQLDTADWKLELIGDGSLMPKLKEISNIDKRIVLTGLMPNNQVVKRQQQASVLVNPRKGNKEFTKYSFPSKTIEYMASGTPMLGYRLSGIPDEYFEYIFEIPAEENGLKDCLEKLICMSEESRAEMGYKAKMFIQTKKNAKIQCSKIISLMEELKR